MIFGCDNKRDFNEGIIKSEVLKEIQKCEDGWNKGNLTDYMQSYLQSDSLRFSGNNSYRFGWKAVLENYKRGYPNKEAMGSLTFSELDVKAISKDAALVFGRFTTARTSDTLTGLFTLLMRKYDNDWRIVHDHSSANY